MNKPDWAKVLRIFYEGDPMLAPAKMQIDDSDYIIQVTGMEAAEATLAVQYLFKTGMLEKVSMGQDTDMDAWRLTKKGFDVAHERELRSTEHEILNAQNETLKEQHKTTEAQHETGRQSTRLSGYLVVAIAIQALVTITLSEPGLHAAILSLLVFFVILLVLLELNRRDVNKIIRKTIPLN